MTNNPVPPEKSYVYAFSTAKLVLLVCIVLVLIALSLMLGIRIERYQRTDEVSRLEAALSQAVARKLPEPDQGEGDEALVEPSVPAAVPAASDPVPPALPETAKGDTVAKADAVSPAPHVEDSKASPEVAETTKASSSPPSKPEASSTPSPNPPAQPPKEQSVQRGHYAVQVFSTQEKATADYQTNFLKKKGFDSYIEDIDLGVKGRYFRVLVGPFGTEGQAKEALSKLKKEPDFANGYVRYLP